MVIKEGIPMKISKTKIILGVLILAFLIFCFQTLLPKDTNIAMSMAKEETNYKPVKNVTNNSNDPMKNLYSFAFKIDEEMVQLPISLPDFIKLGWSDQTTIPDDPFEFIPMDHQWFTKNDISLHTYFNSSEEFPATMDKYYLSSVSLASEDYKDHTVTLPKGIVLGKSSEEEILKTYGRESEILEDFTKDSYAILYQYDARQTIVLVMDEESEILEEIILSYEKPLTKTALPESLKNEQPRTSLPEGISSEAFAIDGAIYNLPTAMSSFTKEGWKIKDKDVIIPSNDNQTKKYMLEKNDYYLFVSVKNYSELPADINDCHVVAVEFARDEPFAIALPGGLEQYENIDAVRSAAANFKITEEYYGQVDPNEPKQLDNIRIKTGTSSQIQVSVEDDQKTVRYYIITNYPKENLGN